MSRVRIMTSAFDFTPSFLLALLFGCVKCMKQDMRCDVGSRVAGNSIDLG